MTDATRPMTPPTIRNGFIEAGGARLAFDYYDRGADILAVVSHGIFCHRRMPELRRLAEHLASHFDVLVYDARGHGDSTGRFTLGAREWSDLGEVVAAQRGGHRAVAGIGFSFGAMHTCVAAAKLACFDAIVLISGPKSYAIFDHNPFTRAFVDTLRLGRARPRRRTRLAFPLTRRTWPIRCIAEVRAPIHFIHGDRDWLIHPRHARALYRRATAPAELTILAGGFHAEYLVTQMPDRFLPAVSDWLAERLAPESGRVDPPPGFR